MRGGGGFLRSGFGSGGLLRRRTLFSTGLTFGGLAAAAGIAGCSTVRASPAAKPISSPPATVLLASIPFQGNGNYQGTMQQLMEEFIAQNFTAKHPGVVVKTQAGSGANGSNTGSQALTVAALAGQKTPDTLCGCCNDLPTYLAANMLMPLDPLLKQNNVDLSNFSPGHMQALQWNGQQIALPQYDGPEVLVYNQGTLDQLGLSYPSAGWTSDQASTLWQSCASDKNGKRIYGVGLDTGDPEWLVHGFGGLIGNADGTQALLDSAPNIAAYTWLSGLLTNHVASGNGYSSVQSGGQAFAVAGGWDIQSIALSFRSLKWDFIGMPTFPGGKPSTFINNDFNAINAFTKNPIELVWELFSFITLNAQMQYFQYKTTFITPNQINLWPAWIQLITNEAPPLKSKNLKAYQDAVSYGWSTYFFKYAPLQANAVEGNWLGQITSGKVSPPVGLRQANTQINAMEAEAAAMAKTANAAATLFPAQGAAIAPVVAGI